MAYNRCIMYKKLTINFVIILITMERFHGKLIEINKIEINKITILCFYLFLNFILFYFYLIFFIIILPSLCGINNS